MQIRVYKKQITDIISFEALPFVLYSTEKRTPLPIEIWYPVGRPSSQLAPKRVDRVVLNATEVQYTLSFSQIIFNYKREWGLIDFLLGVNRQGANEWTYGLDDLLSIFKTLFQCLKDTMLH